MNSNYDALSGGVSAFGGLGRDFGRVGHLGALGKPGTPVTPPPTGTHPTYFILGF